MGLNQKISLVLSADDKTGTAFRGVIGNLGNLGKGMGAVSSRAAALAKVSDQLAAANSRLASATGKSSLYTQTASGIDKVSLAQQRSTLAVLENQRAVDRLSTSLKQQLALEGQIAQNALRTTTLSNTRNRLQRQVAPGGDLSQNLTVASRRVTGSQMALQIAVNDVAKKGANATPADALKLYTANTNLKQANVALRDSTLALSDANEKLQVTEEQLNITNQAGLDLKARMLTADQLAVDMDIEATGAKIRLKAAQLSENETVLAGALALDAQATAQARVNALQEEKKLASRAPSLVPAVLTGLGAAATIAGFVGFESSKKALDFQSTEAQLAAQTNTPLSTVKQVGNATLGFAAGGQSQFDATTVLKGSVLDLATQLPASVIKAVLPNEARVAGIFKQPDLSSIATAINAEIGFLGTGKNTTSGTINKQLQGFTLAEQNTRANPGDVINALPQLFSGLKGSGISSSDALGLESGLVNATGISPQRIATWLGQLTKTAILKPNPQAIALANQIGLKGMFGQAGLAKFGNDPFAYLQNISDQVGTGPNRNAMIQQLLGGSLGGGGIVAARAFQNLTSGSTLRDAASLSDQYANASGTVGTATTRLLSGEQQKLTGDTNRLGKQMIDLGTGINTIVIPALDALAVSASNGVDSIEAFSTGLSDWLKHHDPTALIPKQVKDVASSFWNNIPGILKFPLVANPVSAMVFGTTAVAAKTAQEAYDHIPGVKQFINANGDALGTLANQTAALLQGRGSIPSFITSRFGVPQLKGSGMEGGAGKSGSLYLPSAADQGQNLVPQRFILGNDTHAAIIAANTARNAQVLQAKVIGDNFKTNFQGYQNNVAGINAGTLNVSTGDMQKYAASLLKELQNPIVKNQLGPKAVLADTGTINRELLQLEHKRNMEAADLSYQNAVAQQQNVAQETTNIAKNDAAAKDVYAKQLASLGAQFINGKITSQQLATGGTLAHIQENKDFVAALQPALAEAQAKLSLSQGTGLGVPGAEKGLADLLKQEFNLGGISKNALQLALYQIGQTTNDRQTPGPQLVRPGQFSDSLDVSFQGNASHISAVRPSSNQERQLVALEQTVQYLQQQLTIDQQELAEYRAARQALQSIDKKTPVPVKGKPAQKQGVDPASVRAPL